MTRWPSSSDSWLSKNAPLSRRFSKKRLMDCSRHAERPNNARPTAHVARLFACAGVMLVAFHLRRLQDREFDTGYDTPRGSSDGALAVVSQTAVYDTC